MLVFIFVFVESTSKTILIMLIYSYNFIREDWHFPKGDFVKIWLVWKRDLVADGLGHGEGRFSIFSPF